MLKIDQKRYIENLLKVEGMISCHATLFFIKVELFIFINQAGDNNSTNLTIYQMLVEKLIYLAYGTWLDISFVVALLSQYNSDPRVGHIHITQ